MPPRAPFVIDADPTGLLPAPNPDAAKLCDADFIAAAGQFGLEAALIHAVAEVESGGRTGFDAKGRPKILFEGHIFHKRTGGKYDDDYPEISQPTWNLAKPYYSWDQWTRMYEAMQLDCDAALSAASWGMFQVMGFNHNGWSNVRDFVNAMFESEAQHLAAFLAYCRDNHLFAALRNKDFAAFAEAYNGAGYAQNQYDTKMQRAYQKYAKGAAAGQK